MSLPDSIIRVSDTVGDGVVGRRHAPVGLRRHLQESDLTNSFDTAVDSQIGPSAGKKNEAACE